MDTQHPVPLSMAQLIAMHPNLASEPEVLRAAEFADAISRAMASVARLFGRFKRAKRVSLASPRAEGAPLSDSNSLELS